MLRSRSHIRYQRSRRGRIGSCQRCIGYGARAHDGVTIVSQWWLVCLGIVPGVPWC